MNRDHDQRMVEQPDKSRGQAPYTRKVHVEKNSRTARKPTKVGIVQENLCPVLQHSTLLQTHMASASKLARSFLHLLDGCEAAKIFQYLSAKPHQPRWWPCYIATQDILNAFRCGGIIRDAAVTAQAQVELLESHQAHAV